MIPVSEPFLGDRELDYVTECVRSGWISSSGEFIDRFEAGWAARCGRRYGVAVSNGTVALQLALAALELSPGDEVLIPASTIVSCALAVIYNGGTPVLVDADPETWCLDVRQIERRITSRTRAIMPVHIYGHPVDMAPVLDLAERHGLAVVEDAAEAHGAEYRMPDGTWAACGSFGDVSTFSFYANKLITTGEGGMVVTDDPDLAARARLLRNLAFVPDQRFLHPELGFNFRMTNLQAALGVAQLERFDDLLARKRWLGATYDRLLADVPGLQTPVEKDWARNVYWMYGVVVEDQHSLDAIEFARRLRARGVDSRPFFLGMHEQPAFIDRGLFVDEAYPVAERLARRGLYLPSGPALTEEELVQVSDAVRECLAA